MSGLENDINIALKILYNEPLNEEEKLFYNRIYPWSNEEIYRYYKYYDLTNKQALCITSSGDHLLYAVAAGANNIDSLDKNRLCKYYAALKVAVILAYDKKTFFRLFHREGKCIISNKLELNAVKNYLDEDYFVFWEEIMNTKAFKKNKSLFRFDGFPSKFRLDYNLLREALSRVNISYYDMDVQNFFKHTTKSYDAIFLSNVLEWIIRMNQYDILISYINLLNHNGVLYDYMMKRDFSNSLMGVPKFESILGDEILVYRRKKSCL